MKTETVSAEIVKARGEVKIRLFHDDKTYIVRLDAQDFETLIHRKGEVTRKVTQLN